MAEPEYSRTEQATPFKRSEARKKGQVAKSLDFNTAVMLGGFSAVLAVGAPGALERLAGTFSRLLIASGDSRTEADLGAAMLAFVQGLSGVMLPVFAAAAVLAIVANVVQAGPVFSAEPIKPQLSRLNPLTGFKRIYNLRVLVEGLKSVVKLVAFSLITIGFFESVWPTLPDLLNADPAGDAGWFALRAKALIFRLLLALLVIGVLDILWARWQYAKQLRMSPREIKEEHKRREGDPLIRRRLRELQRENLKQARALGRVGEADVLITNPTHVAVALAYDRATMQAPTVIARGADLWAEQMKTQARKHGVVILERRSLARRLYRFGVLDRAIPADTYLDVARVYSELARARATVVTGRAAVPAAGERP